MASGSRSHKRVLVIAKRVLRQLRRDKRSLAMIIVQPIIMMAIFGYALGGDVTDVRVAVANLDRGHLGQEILDRIDRDAVIVVPYGSEALVARAVEAREVSVGVVFPVNFTRNFESAASPNAKTAYLVFYADNTNPTVSGSVKGEFVEAFGDAVEDESDRPASFDVDERVVFGPEEGENLEFLLPGMVAFTVFMIGTMLTGVAIVKERTEGTLARILVSPATKRETVLGFAAAFATLGLAQAAVVLAISSFVFGVNIAGPVLLALTATFLVSLMALGLGILLSGIAKNEFQATQSVMLVAFPNMFLAGLLAPLEAMPEIVRPLAKAMPLTYAVNAERAIINHGAGFVEVLPDLFVLTLFVAGFLALGAFAFGRRT